MKRPIEELIVGESPVMRELRANVLRCAPLDLNAVIMGPTGSGKELVAQALHEYSARRGPFVPVNVCAIPESTFESAMFGHRRGAFTGAVSNSPGFMKEADGGTLFLDEIGDLELAVQVKLLRAIDTGCFRPLGAPADVRSNCRIIVATNRDIPTMLRDGRFREDLWFRLAAVAIRTPPLTARRDDIPLLSESWLAGVLGSGARLETSGAASLVIQSWPGNVRELKHVVRLAAAFGHGRVDASSVAAALSVARGATELDSGHEDERARMLQVLADHDWRLSVVADRCGVHVATLYRRLERLGIRIKSMRLSRTPDSSRAVR